MTSASDSSATDRPARLAPWLITGACLMALAAGVLLWAREGAAIFLGAAAGALLNCF